MTRYDASASRRPAELDYTNALDRPVATFFNFVYAWMFCGLGVTATAAWLTSRNPEFVYAISGGGMSIVFLLISLACIIGIQRVAPRVNPTVGLMLFLGYSAFIGVILSGIFLAFSLPELGRIFAITAGTFAGASIYGFVTKRDLTTVGSIALMALWGLILASVVNVFFGSSQMSWIISFVGVGVVVALVAWETQDLRNLAVSLADDPQMAQRYAVVGALVLYVSFINLFMFLLRLLGNRE
ncbi:MAG: Bax inhibitor-1 family protein [Phycisphaerae bacterium]